MRTYAIVPLSLVSLAALVAPAAGQSLSARAIAQINASALVHVRLVDGECGMLITPDADSTTLRYGESRVRNRGGSVVQLAAPLPIADLIEIQRPIGTNAGKGAKIGAGIGAGLALLAVIAASSDEWTRPTTGQSVAAIGVWTLLGAGVGSLIGNGSKRWETVYRAP
ncbi:MAG TPA: hypothetical protein VGQ48_02630 [Gemmatimonadales bacterium]|nr:hypothetical protein [Gemmatimonadales bacterium]